MNITLIMGWGIAIGCTVASIIMAGSGINTFIDASSIFIVVGGTLGALIANYPMDDIKKIMTLVKIAFKKSDVNLEDQIENIVDMANIARKNGLLALEEKTRTMEDPFIKNAVMLVLDGTDPDLVKNVMETEVYFMDERHSKYAGIFLTGSSLAPAFGMVGTLIGLIAMLQELNDPSTLGPKMAVALITTFYGVLLANILFNPIAKQLQSLNAIEIIQKDIIIEGILSIQDGENPRVIRDKLRAFVAKSELKPVDENSGGGASGAA